MADSMNIANFPSPGTPQRVAYDMAKFLFPPAKQGQTSEDRKTQFIDLYAECLEAALGRR